MTTLMEEAIDVLRKVPSELQDDLARLVMQLAGKDQPVYELTAEEERDIAAADAEMERGEFLTDQQVRAIWAKHDL